MDKSVSIILLVSCPLLTSTLPTSDVKNNNTNDDVSKKSPPHITVNHLDHPNVTSIDELSPRGITVALVVVKDTDPRDNIICRTVYPSVAGVPIMFMLQELSYNQYMVELTGLLDREKTSSYDVTITCRDLHTHLNSSVTFKVKVIDVNDNSPVFSHSVEFQGQVYTPVLRVDVEENNQIGAVITTVNATDADDVTSGNGQVTYSLDTDYRGTFSIDPDTGDLKAMKSLDYELDSKYILEVVATDHGSPPRSAKATVVLNVRDLNDVSPMFSKHTYTFTVTPEMMTKAKIDAGTSLIGRVEASDRDQGNNGRFYFWPDRQSFTCLKATTNTSDVTSNGNITNTQCDDVTLPVYVQMDTGDVYLTQPLDTDRVYSFEVTATDMGIPPLTSRATVVINVKVKDDAIVR